MWRKPSTVLFVLASAGAVALTGCGSDAPAPRAASGSSGSGSVTASQSSSATASPSADSNAAAAAIKASIAAARSAKTFEVSANGVEDGKTLKLDLHYGSNGVDGSVVTMGTEFEIKSIDDTIYFKAPSAFWRSQGGAQGDTIAARYGDKWVRTAATSQVGKGFSEFGSSAKFLAGFTKGFDDLGGAKQVGTNTVDGKPTKTYTDDTNEGTIDIAASGTPYPLELDLIPGTTNKVKGKIGLSKWNEPYTVEAPSDSVSLPS